MTTRRTESELAPISVTHDRDRFFAAAGTPGSGVYHHQAWEQAIAVYGLRAEWLVASRGDRVVARLPLVRQSSRLFGRRLASLPWVDEAGAVGHADGVAELLRHAAELVDQLGCSYSAVIKQPVGTAQDTLPEGWSLADGDKVLIRRRLPKDSDALWKDLSPKVRNQVRKAEKRGLVTERGGTELVEDFFRVYARNMRDLGSPSHSLAFFRTLVTALGDRAAVYCTRLNERPVGAGIVLSNQASLDIPWASSLREFNSMCVNHGLYAKILADACEQGFEWFHFGRSTVGSGQHRFKKQWGVEETNLSWWAYAPRYVGGAEERPNDLRQGFRLAERLWTKLPVSIARRIGPSVIRHVP